MEITVVTINNRLYGPFFDDISRHKFVDMVYDHARKKEMPIPTAVSQVLFDPLHYAFGMAKEEEEKLFDKIVGMKQSCSGCTEENPKSLTHKDLESDKTTEQAVQVVLDAAVRKIGKGITTDRNDSCIQQIQPNGQQACYLELSEEERAKGFVRPVRRSYRHVGIAGPKYQLRDLTGEEKEWWKDDPNPFVKFEIYPEELKPATGRYWTQRELDSINKGCGTVTTMGIALAETYAAQPNFYSGTFCSNCGKHFAIGEEGEFVWEGSNERVGT